MTQQEQEILGKQMLALARSEGHRRTEFREVAAARKPGESSRKVLGLLTTRGQMTSDQMARLTGLSVQSIRGIFSNLRIAGKIETYRGGQGRKCTYRVVT